MYMPHEPSTEPRMYLSFPVEGHVMEAKMSKETGSGIKRKLLSEH